MLSAFFTVFPASGDVLATNFTVTNFTSGASVARYSWDPGIRDISNDIIGTVNTSTSQLIYNIKDPVFNYKLPGIYTITLSATDFDNNTSVFSQTITADFAYRDYVKFTRIPDKYPDPGKLTDVPFEIELLTTNIDTPLVVDLFATNSPSTPIQFIPNKWSFINPTWKFLDKNFNTVTSLSVTPIPVYKNNVVVAVSGTAEFYYVDSMSVGDPTKNCPVLITATLQTSGFSNFGDSSIYPYSSHANNLTVRTGLVWHVNDLLPNTLKVTGNYIDDINTKQWKDIKIPFLITCHSNRSLILSGAEDSLSEVIFSYPENNVVGKISPVEITLSNVNRSDYVVDEEPLYFQATTNGFRTGGYIFTALTSNTTAANTSIFAQTTANKIFLTQPDNNFFLDPAPFAPTPSVWVSNPNQNTINKITLIPDPGTCKTINFLRDVGVLADGTIKEYAVPSKNDNSTFNYEMSGFSGIYGVAIDPRDYSVIAADTELDRIYRISNTGQILKTFELSSLEDYDPQKKLFSSWSWIAPSSLSSISSYTFYSPTQITTNKANYILVAGGLIQPNDLIRIENQKQTLVLDISSNYLEEDVVVDLIQIYNPLLPDQISTLQYWTLSSTIPTTTFNLTGSPSLSSNGNYYIVSVDGVLQRPENYTISNSQKTITFTTPILPNLPVTVLYVPAIRVPASWNFTFTAPTTSISLTGIFQYRRDSKSAFVVNVGGVFQSPISFTHNPNTQRLNFVAPLPVNTPIHIRQFSIPQTVYAPAAYTPAYVSMDRDYNIWVSLFNAVSVLKFDSDLNLLFSTAPSGLKWIPRIQTVSPQGIDYQSSLYGDTVINTPFSSVGVDYYYNDFFLKPPVTETDKDNNCWVTYSNPLCSMIAKFSSTGEELLQITPEAYSMPMNVTINAQNNCWISNFYGSSYESTPLLGSIQLYDTNTGNVLSSIKGVSRPGHISLDRNNNLWFTHGVNRLGYFNTRTSTLSMWTLSSDGFTLYTIPTSNFENNFLDYDRLENEEDDYFGGLAVDVFNRVWVIDNMQNFAWVISASPNFLDAPIRNFKVRPIPVLGYYTNTVTGETYTESLDDYFYRSAQATGDWTGNRWYQKYASPNVLTNVVLTGISNNISVTDFINNHQIRKINESFNTAEYYKSLALPEVLNSNTKLFDSFFAAAVGTGMLSANEDLGQEVYERIANYTINHADIDTCGIDQLLSLAEQVAVPALDYAATYPREIKNMLDVASVPRSKLWGIKDEIPLIPQSLGEKYNTQTDFITAGTKIILRDKLDSTLSLIQVPSESNSTVYPLSSLSAFGFRQPVLANYIFYRLNPIYSNEYIENVIDWDSPYTTQSINLSSINDWYGTEGGIETAFRYLLTKNLFLK